MVVQSRTFGKSVLALAGGTAASQLVTLLALPFITRLYSPADMGVFSLFTSYVAFGVTLLTLRYESALLIAPRHNLHALVNACGFILFLAAALLSLILAILPHFKHTGFDVLPPQAPIIAFLVFLGMGVFMIMRSIALRDHRAGDIARATFGRAAMNNAGRLVFGFLGVGSIGLVVSEIGGAAVAGFSLLRRYWGWFVDRSSSPRRVWLAVRKYRKFPVYEQPSVIVNQLAILLPVPIITALYGPAAAGWFGLAKLAVAIPNAQLGKAVADTFQSHLAGHVRAGRRSDAHRLFWRLARRLALFGLLPLVGVVLLAPPLMPFILGPSWAPTGRLAALIAPWLYGAFVAGSLSRLLLVLQRQELKLIYDLTSLGAVVLSFSLGHFLGWDLYATIALFSALGLAVYVLYFFILTAAIRRYSLDGGAYASP